jgi:hypothetical protein
MMRIPMLAGQAVVTLQIYYSNDFTLNKYDVLPRYERNVPGFKEKEFGTKVWKEYLEGEQSERDWLKIKGHIPDLDRIIPFKEYYGFLKAARDLVTNNPV